MINDITIAGTAHYRLRTTNVVRITFAGDIWGKGSDTSISIKLKVENRNNRPFLTIINKDFQVGSVAYKGKGKSQDLQKMKIESCLKTPGFNVNFGLMNQPQLTPSELQIPIIGQFWFNGHKDDNPPTVFPSKNPFPLTPPERQFCLNIDSNLAFRSAVYAFNVSDKSVFRIDQPIFGKLDPDRKNFMMCNCQGENCLVSMVPKLKEKCPNGKSIWIHGILQVGADLLANNSGLIFYASGNGNFCVDFGDDKYDGNGEENA
uniref:Uncharacterized protein n=1 Tax=Panagrolaimus sp. PS1159 TaxID=55785 RepID=A0AC35GU29_9BILA